MKAAAALAAAAVVVSSGIAFGGVWHTRQIACAAANKALRLQVQLLTVSYRAPHRFNAPIDLARRRATYDRQVAEIRQARCG